jgi:hypothetical protein
MKYCIFIISYLAASVLMRFAGIDFIVNKFSPGYVTYLSPKFALLGPWGAFVYMSFASWIFWGSSALFCFFGCLYLHKSRLIFLLIVLACWYLLGLFMTVFSLE